MKFSRATSREEPAAAKLRALHLSLNTPVVAIDDFPVGPARAGVLLAEASEAGLRLEIAVRAVRTGQLLFYRADDAIAAGGAASRAVDAALSFAEGMGFLFDEDEVAARGASGEREAVALWRSLLGEVGEPVPVAATGLDGRGADRFRENPVIRGPAPGQRNDVRDPQPLELVDVVVAMDAVSRPALSKFRLSLGPTSSETPVDEPQPEFDVPVLRNRRFSLLGRFLAGVGGKG